MWETQQQCRTRSSFVRNHNNVFPPLGISELIIKNIKNRKYNIGQYRLHVTHPYSSRSGEILINNQNSHYVTLAPSWKRSSPTPIQTVTVSWPVLPKPWLDPLSQSNTPCTTVVATMNKSSFPSTIVLCSITTEQWSLAHIGYPSPNRRMNEV